MIDVTEILMHWHAGRSLSEMAESLDVDRKTLRKYICPAAAAGIVPGGRPEPGGMGGAGAGLVPAAGRYRLRQVTWPAIGKHHETSAPSRRPGCGCRRSISGCAMSTAWLSACRVSAGTWRRTCRKRSAARRCGYWTRARPRPGSRRRSTTAAGPLAGSGHREAAHGAGVRHGLALFAAHVRAAGAEDGPAGVDRMPRGGIRLLRRGSARLVPDNLRTGVDKPDLYDPKVNRSYAEMAAHYGCLIDPARSRKPWDKARVERPMPTYGTRSGGAGSSPAWRRCRPRRPLVRGRRAAAAPPAGRSRPGRGVRRDREGRAAAAAR